MSAGPEKPVGEAPESEGWTGQLQGVTESISSILDQGLATASDAVRSGTALASAEANKAAEQAKGLVTTVKGEFDHAENIFFSTLRASAAAVREHEQESLVIGGAALLLAVPAARQLLWRQTLGRLRSKEAVFKSAELRCTSLADRVAGQELEVKKLQERLGMAQAEYSRGLSKLTATARELEQLSGRIGSSQRTARGLIDDLRTLPQKQALTMRSQVAQNASTSATQRRVIDRLIVDLAKQGI